MTRPFRRPTCCQNTDLDGVEATVLPGELQQRHQCLQQEGGSTCLQNETSLGDKHATLTVEDKDKCKCAAELGSRFSCGQPAEQAASRHSPAPATIPEEQRMPPLWLSTSVWIRITPVAYLLSWHHHSLVFFLPLWLNYIPLVTWAWELKDTNQPASQPEQVLRPHEDPNPNCVCCLVCSWCYYKPSTQFWVALLRSIFASCMHAWPFAFTPRPHVILLPSAFHP